MICVQNYHSFLAIKIQSHSKFDHFNRLLNKKYLMQIKYFKFTIYLFQNFTIIIVKLQKDQNF